MMFACFLSNLDAKAQFTTLPGVGLRLTNINDKFGIGAYSNLSNPVSTLTVGGNISLYPVGTTSRNILAHTANSVFTLAADQGSTNGPTIELYGRNHARHGEITFVSYGSNAGNKSFNFLQYDNIAATWKTLMVLTDDGRLILGGNTPNTTAKYGLYVADGILAEQVKVALKNSADWSDFVFAPNYKLMPLPQLSTYIRKNKHLPDVPSAEKVVQQGIDVAKMDALLLQKIEELTLYIIELEARLKALEEQQK
jgi:hypothetical protein